jgi:hypothetical protein
MTSQRATPIQHPPRIVQRHASGSFILVMLIVWFCDFVGGRIESALRTKHSIHSELTCRLTVAQRRDDQRHPESQKIGYRAAQRISSAPTSPGSG